MPTWKNIVVVPHTDVCWLTKRKSCETTARIKVYGLLLLVNRVQGALEGLPGATSVVFDSMKDMFTVGFATKSHTTSDLCQVVETQVVFRWLRHFLAIFPYKNVGIRHTSTWPSITDVLIWNNSTMVDSAANL